MKITHFVQAKKYGGTRKKNPVAQFADGIDLFEEEIIRLPLLFRLYRPSLLLPF